MLRRAIILLFTLSAATNAASAVAGERPETLTHYQFLARYSTLSELIDAETQVDYRVFGTFGYALTNDGVEGWGQRATSWTFRRGRLTQKADFGQQPGAAA